MKNLSFYLLAIILSCLSFSSNSLYSQLRPGIEVDQSTSHIANELDADGWEYIMPKPKSPQASWGNSDGRTTWWLGYWKKRSKYSESTPRKDSSGKYNGDGINNTRVWRRGGRPSTPSQLEWLLSKEGGIKP
jgi:hypothetical protein